MKIKIKQESIPVDLTIMLNDPRFVLWVRTTREKFSIPDKGFESASECIKWVNEYCPDCKKVSLEKYSEQEFYLVNGKLKPSLAKTQLTGKYVKLPDYITHKLHYEVQARFPTFPNLWLNAIDHFVMFGYLVDKDNPNKLNQVTLVEKTNGDELQKVVRIEIDPNTTQDEFRNLYGKVTEYQKLLPRNQKGKLRKKDNLLRDVLINQLTNQGKNQNKPLSEVYEDSIEAIPDEDLNEQTFRKSNERFTNRLARLLLDTIKD